MSQNNSDYQRIEKAIAFLRGSFREQPSLEQAAAHVHLSEFHFQKMFTQWAGVSPKKFLQYLTASYAKNLLQHNVTVSEAAHSSGLSGSGRLHDLFVKIEGMTPGEFKNRGAGLDIRYGMYPTPFGNVFIASTRKGICRMVFYENEHEPLEKLTADYENAQLLSETDNCHLAALNIFNPSHSPAQMKLHLKGTSFQIKVWEALLKIPMGAVSTYGDIALQLNHQNAARAVGTAVGSNPVAYLIPCHRVIRKDGNFGEYMWGSARKTAIIGWEGAQSENTVTD
jgi:AraC family transcriptional regulator of adaptative response/methylated-DNA-[protein]-cysteine methyltransferase